MRYGLLVSPNETDKSSETDAFNGTEAFKVWYQKTGTPKATAHRYWDAFKTANDLTTLERKEMGMRYGTLVNDKKSEGDKTAEGDKRWFPDWYAAANIPQKTAHRYWDAFKTANDLTITPSKATKEQQQLHLPCRGR